MTKRPALFRTAVLLTVALLAVRQVSAFTPTRPTITAPSAGAAGLLWDPTIAWKPCAALGPTILRECWGVAVEIVEGTDPAKGGQPVWLGLIQGEPQSVHVNGYWGRWRFGSAEEKSVGLLPDRTYTVRVWHIGAKRVYPGTGDETTGEDPAWSEPSPPVTFRTRASYAGIQRFVYP